jgi:hypothetical protein
MEQEDTSVNRTPDDFRHYIKILGAGFLYWFLDVSSGIGRQLNAAFEPACYQGSERVNDFDTGGVGI